MKNKFLISILLFVLLTSIVSAESLTFGETWENYDTGNFYNVTGQNANFWVISSPFTNVSQVVPNSYSSVTNVINYGSQSAYLNVPDNTGVSVKGYPYITPLSSGVFNFWVRAKQGSGSDVGTISLKNSVGGGLPFAQIQYTGTDFKVHPSAYSWSAGFGETMPNSTDIVNNAYWVRIRVDFDNDRVNYFMYADDNADFKDTALISANTVTYSIDTVLEDFDQIILGVGTTSKLVVDDIFIYEGNDDPVVSNVVITPIPFDVFDGLTCSYDFFDENRDLDSSKIEWFVNDVEKTFYQNSSTLPIGQFTYTDEVRCEVTAFDSIDFGNVGSASCIEGTSECEIVGEGSPEVFEDEVVFSGELVDFDVTGVDIRALDYFESDLGLSAYVVFAGVDSGVSYIGVADLFTPDSFGSVVTQNTGSQNYYAVDNYDTTIWSASDLKVQRFSNVFSSLGFGSITPKSYNSSGEYYIDLVAIDDNNAVACYYLGGVEGLLSFFYNSSSGNIENLDVVQLEKCRSLVYDDVNNLVFADSGLNGTAVVDVSDLNSLSLVSYQATRIDYSYSGRGDTLDLIGDNLFTDSYYNFGFEYDVSNPSSFDVTDNFCGFDDDSGLIYALDMIDTQFIILSNANDGNVYACDSVAQTVNSIYENPAGVSLGRDIVAFEEGNIKYIYTSADDNLQILKLTSFNESVNQLPTFISATPDSQFLDNFNPITINTTPVGLESPNVYVYPLSCVSPLYECSTDFEGDTILFAVDKDNDGTLDTSFTSTENVFVNYAVAGIYTLRLYITDDVHPDNLQTYRDFTVNVTGESVPLLEGEDTLKFRVLNSFTQEPVSNVEIRGSFEGNDTNSSLFGYTNSNGELVSVVDEGYWLVEFSKNEFITQANYFSTTALTHEVQLEPISETDKRTLIITVKDDNLTLLPNIFVELFMPLTASFDFKVTDANGKVTFTPDEDNVVLTVQKAGYDTFEESISVSLGTTVSRTVLLSNISISKIGSCQDYIEDTWLCGVDNVQCVTDEECVSGRCSVDGTCSSFNWNICDENDMERSDRCVMKYTALGVAKGFTNGLLDYFLYVLAGVVLLVGVVIIWSMSRANK